MKCMLCVAILSLGFVQPGQAANVGEGRVLYTVCAGCHGFKAEGSFEVAAPKLTGLDTVYLTRQIRYFAEGVRGTDSADTHGQRMAPFALALPDERAVEDVVAYIDSLAHVPPPSTAAGNPAQGREIYAVCAACHGHSGEGVAALMAPALNGLDDWYVVRQLELYRDGLRGSHPADLYGQQMRPIAGNLRNDQQLLDLAAYIETLSSTP